jgi:hypothetical protein
MAGIHCGGCGHSISPAPDGRLAPWCPKCGQDLKAGTVAPAPAVPEPIAAVAAAVMAPNPGEIARQLDALDAGQPLSRAYRHVSCGQSTVVSGDDYVLLECPFRPVSGTFCCGCGKFVLLNEVRWVDSDEKISDYRDRVYASVPFWRKVWLSLFCNAYQGAVNLHLDSRGRPLRSAANGPAAAG